jgi:hypothetical protein
MSTNNQKQIVMENTNNFNFLHININDISFLNWSDPYYLDKILNLDIYNVVTTNSENFLDDIALHLNFEQSKNLNYMIETHVIAEFPEYIYEILYINNIDNKYKNDIGTLLMLNGDKIFGNIIILKTYLPNDSMLFVDSQKSDIKFILESRIKTKVVICEDGEWLEKVVMGNLIDFANEYFDDNYLKIEKSFLKHNINIWYEKDNNNINKKNICGKLLDIPIYKCILFTMLTDECRGNITLDEINKIIYLSYKLDFPFSVDYNSLIEEKDNYNRYKIKNKYKILEKVYQENK